jgi:anti-sigma B factor antagonist
MQAAASPPAAIEVAAHSPEVAVVTLRGEHDLHSWSEVTIALANASQRSCVLVELSECTFLDSTMLTVLLVAAKQLRLRAGSLAVVIPPGSQVLRIFEVMNVHTLVVVHESLAAAIATLPAEPACERAAGADAA